MNKDFYNNEKQYESLIKSLQKLPKIKAPDNFEYNLMIKIQNGQFETNDNRKLNLSWTFGPSLALLFSAFIIFYITTDSINEVDDPFDQTPVLRSQAQTVAEKPAGEISNLEEEDFSKQVSKENFEIVVNSNDAVTNEANQIPLDEKGNVDLDKFINQSSKNGKKQIIKKSMPGASYFKFESFFIRKGNNSTGAKKDTIN